MVRSIKELLTRDVLTIAKDETLAVADELMRLYEIRHLPIVDAENRVIGILSNTDFKALKKMRTDLKSYKVKDFMTSPAICISPDSTVQEVVRLFIWKKINCVLVTENHLARGILTSEDLLKLVANLEETKAS